MSFRRSIDLFVDSITQRVDAKLLEYLDKFITSEMSDIEKAVTIYLCLGDVLSYSVRFSLFHNYSNTTIVSDISLDKNEVVCKNWSILFQRILKHYGISSKVTKYKGHYKVEIITGDFVYSCDATGYGGYGYRYSMSDLARIKNGFMIQKFAVLSSIDFFDTYLLSEKRDELVKIIESIYKKQNRKYIKDEDVIKLGNKVFDHIILNANKVGHATEEDLDYRIKLINRFWGLRLNDSTLEKMQLFNSFFNVVFQDYEEYVTKCYNIFSKVNGKITIYKLIAVEIDSEYYYYFDNGKKFIKMSRKELLDEFWARNVRISEFTEIIGIYSGTELFKVR